MELDEMKLAWQGLDRRLEQQHALGLSLFRDSRLDKARHGLRPLAGGQILQLAIGIVLAGVAAIFWIPRLHVVHLLVCGLLVHAYGLLLIIFAVRNLYLIGRIDFAAPVLSIQHDLASLRAWRVRVEAPVHTVLGCFVWIPVTWMNFAWYGIDLWSPTFIYWSLSSSLVGLAVSALVVWFMRRAGMAGKLEDRAAGRSLQKAETMLEELARFERE